MTVLAIVGLGIGLAVIAVLTFALWSRPADLFAIFFVLGVGGLAVVVSWEQVARYRAQKAAIGDFDQRVAAGSGATGPAADQPRRSS